MIRTKMKMNEHTTLTNLTIFKYFIDYNFTLFFFYFEL